MNFHISPPKKKLVKEVIEKLTSLIVIGFIQQKIMPLKTNSCILILTTQNITGCELMALRIRRSRLPELLLRAGKTQVDLANHLDVTESHISRVIKLKSNLSYIKLKMTADFLNCTIDELVEWDYD